MRLRAQQSWPALPNTAIGVSSTAPLPVGIGEHDARRLAAELQRDPGDVVGRCPQDRGSGRRLTGERDLVDPTVAHQRVADHATGTGEDRDASVGHARLDEELTEHRARSPGCSDAGLMMTGLPHASAGAVFQQVMSSGKFHGTIERADADRLAQHDVEPRVLHRNDLAEVLVRGTGVVLERPGGGLDLPARVADRLPRVARLDRRDRLGRSRSSVATRSSTRPRSVADTARPDARLERGERGRDGPSTSATPARATWASSPPVAGSRTRSRRRRAPPGAVRRRAGLNHGVTVVLRTPAADPTNGVWQRGAMPSSPALWPGSARSPARRRSSRPDSSRSPRARGRRRERGQAGDSAPRRRRRIHARVGGLRRRRVRHAGGPARPGRTRRRPDRPRARPGAGRGSRRADRVAADQSGGPGVPGTDFVQQVADALPEEITDRFDIVGWDPRATGTSRAGRLRLAARLPLRRRHRARRRDRAPRRGSAARKFADELRPHEPRPHSHISSVDTVHDLDQIRAAFGDAKLTSSGCRTGATSVRSTPSEYPERVRTLLLDGAVDPAAADRGGLPRAVEGIRAVTRRVPRGLRGGRRVRLPP